MSLQLFKSINNIVGMNNCRNIIVKNIRPNLATNYNIIKFEHLFSVPEPEKFHSDNMATLYFSESFQRIIEKNNLNSEILMICPYVLDNEYNIFLGWYDNLKKIYHIPKSDTKKIYNNSVINLSKMQDLINNNYLPTFLL